MWILDKDHTLECDRLGGAQTDHSFNANQVRRRSTIHYPSFHAQIIRFEETAYILGTTPGKHSSNFLPSQRIYVS